MEILETKIKTWYIIGEKILLLQSERKAAGVVDRAWLEIKCTGNCTGGSNPSFSAYIYNNPEAQSVYGILY